MGFFSRFTDVVGSVVSGGFDVVAGLGRNPITSLIPGVSTAASLVGGTRAISNVFGGGSDSRLPPPPMVGGGIIGEARRFGGGTSFANFDPNPGILPRGPGGKLAIPFTNPDVPPHLVPFTLDDQFLRFTLRAPKGYIVARIPGIKPFPLRRDMAIKFNIWRPAKKPPISVTDWESLKRADKVIRKLKVVVKRGQTIANWTPPTKSRPKLKTIPAQRLLPGVVNIDNS